MNPLSLGSFGRVTVANDTPDSWYAPSSAEMARLDADTIRSGIASRELMERAGAAAAERIQERLIASGAPIGPVVVVCGAGNNGGDGLVVARILATQGIAARAIVVAARAYSADCVAQMTVCPVAASMEGSSGTAREACGGRVVSTLDTIEALREAVLIVDALLGTGQRDAPRDGVASLVRAVVEEKVRRPLVEVVSIDIPTGINADTGAVYEPHVRADSTIAIELIKRGMMQFPAREACGDIRAEPIGISYRKGIEFSIIEGSRVPRGRVRTPDAHKGMAGRVLVIAGSAAMPGASALSVLGALRAGTGLVTRVTKPSWQGVAVTPECMQLLVESSEAHFVARDYAALEAACAATDVVVIGPGLGRSRETGDFVRVCLESLRALRKRVVIDADALSLLVSHAIDCRGLEAVITPHPGEASTMLAVSTTEIQSDRFVAVKRLYDQYGVVALLKGAGTLVWDGSQGGIVARGTPYLATAGSGDVLSGIIAACLISSTSVFEASVRGAYIHAVAGERASVKTGGAILASDVAYAASAVIGELVE